MEESENPYYWAAPSASSYWTHLKKTPAYYGRNLYREIMTKSVFLWGQAIAFKVLIATVPVIVLATGILGFVLQGQNAFGTVSTFLERFLPSYQSGKLIEIIHQLQASSSTFTVIGVIGLFFSAMTLFTTLRLVIANVFEEEWNEHRTVMRGYGFDIRMVIQVGLLFLLTMAISVAMQTLQSTGGDFFSILGLDFFWVRRGWRRAINIVGLLLPFILTVGMFFQLFYFTPLPHPPKRCALKGALVTSALWEIAKYCFTVYAIYAGSFDRYSGDSLDGVEGLGNIFGLIIAFVIWAYFSGVVLVIGALVAMLSEKRYRSRIRLQKAVTQEQEAEEKQGQAVSSSSAEPQRAPSQVG